MIGLTPEQKITAALRTLAYGFTFDAVDEYSRVAKTTSRETLHCFTEDILELYQDKYLRKPDASELKKILRDNAERGFPGCIGVVFLNVEN